MTENSFKFDLPTHHKSIIKVIGVGGGGSNAVNHMYNQGITGVEFIVCNTDSQALNTSPIPHKLQIGVDLTEGLGAGANPEKGKNAALENKEDIRNMLSEDTKMIFITAGMGGGTGTGAAPVIAQVAKELGVLTVGIVTVPFKFEGKKKMRQAMEGVESLKANCDTVLMILNDKLTETFGSLSVNQAFEQADNVLTTAAKGIAEIITVPGYVNVDFEDVKTVMKDSGGAVMGSAQTTGDSRARRAAEEAINSPLLNNQNIEGADKILLSIISGDQAELQMDELTEITDFMQELAGDEAEVIFGHGVDSELGESIRVTIIATGFDDKLGETEKTKTETVAAPAPVVNEVIAPAPVVVETPQPRAMPARPQEPTSIERPAAKEPAQRTVFDLNRDYQTDLFSKEIEVNQRDTFEEDFQLKMKSFSFEKPERPAEPEQPFATDVDPFEQEMRKLYEESQRNNVSFDEPLEELDGMAHAPSKKILLMEQQEERRRKLGGIHNEEPLDTSSFKEKFDVPAYQRKKVSLKNIPASSESLVSKYNLNDDNELGNNKFLHDRPD